MPITAHPTRHLLRSSSAAFVLVAAFGCGKPATAEDCERIVTRITELELKAAEISDPNVVQAQITSTKQAFDQVARAECIGRRISAGSLSCVEKATSARQIVEECFD